MLNFVDSLKDIVGSVWRVVTANVWLFFALLAILIIFYYFFLASFATKKPSTKLENQLDRQKKDMWEFEESLSYERVKGFKIAFFLTTILWASLLTAFFQYGFDESLKKLGAYLLSDQEIKPSAPFIDENHKKYTLQVNAQPKQSKVRILNIVEPYREGIQLAPGYYVLEVKADGYYTKYQCVVIKDENEIISITLGKICCN